MGTPSSLRLLQDKFGRLPKLPRRGQSCQCQPVIESRMRDGFETNYWLEEPILLNIEQVLTLASGRL